LGHPVKDVMGLNKRQAIVGHRPQRRCEHPRIASDMSTVPSQVRLVGPLRPVLRCSLDLPRYSAVNEPKLDPSFQGIG
jgi:hypothetical protein